MKLKITGFADEIAPDLTTQMESIKKLNISHIEMRGVDGNNLIFHTDEKVKEIKSRLDENGIRLSALGSPLGKIGILDSFEPHFEQYKRAVEIAHMMECRNIRMFSFYLPEEGATADYEDEVFNRLSKMAEYAKNNEVVLLHENEKGIYGAKAAECKKIMDEFYSPNFKAIFDFANFVQCGENTLEGYNILKPYIDYIHVKDALLKDGTVVPAGYGDGYVKEILTDLFATGFDGFLSIEPHLGDFQGFEALEKNVDSSKVKKLSGFEAFELAHTSLLKCLG